jgi:redox-sensing transcriptional repressor
VTHLPDIEAAKPSGQEIPPAALARLTVYLRVLNSLMAGGTERISSEQLAESAGVSPPTLRKDLSYLGSFGTRGVGYDVRLVSQEISAALGLMHEWKVAIVGVGNLGRALAGYSGFTTKGFGVVALFDADPSVVGSEVAGLRVSPITELESVLRQTEANMAVMAVPAGVAQGLCDRLVAAGVMSILSFAPVVLQVPPSVQLRKVDMATELQILAYHAQRAQETENNSESSARH